MTAFVLNVLVAVVLTVLLRLGKVGNGTDRTVTSDYYADAGDPRVDRDLAEHGGPAAGEPVPDRPPRAEPAGVRAAAASRRRARRARCAGARAR
jgi:SSS family solute:Na+ symporter